jgi:hypothetical protein
MITAVVMIKLSEHSLQQYIISYEDGRTLKDIMDTEEEKLHFTDVVSVIPSSNNIMIAQTLYEEILVPKENVVMVSKPTRALMAEYKRALKDAAAPDGNVVDTSIVE